MLMAIKIFHKEATKEVVFLCVTLWYLSVLCVTVYYTYIQPVTGSDVNSLPVTAYYIYTIIRSDCGATVAKKQRFSKRSTRKICMTFKKKQNNFAFLKNALLLTAASWLLCVRNLSSGLLPRPSSATSRTGTNISFNCFYPVILL